MSRVLTPGPCNPAPVSALARLPLLWLLFVGLALCINSASFGAKAAVGSGYVSQIEHFVFAGNSDPARILPRAADLLGDDGDPAPQWLAIATQLFTLHPPLPLPGLTAPRAVLSSYHGNLFQQAPRAPPSV